MNKLKSLFSRLLLMVTVCHVSHAQAAAEKKPLPVYENAIANISLGYETTTLTGSIELDSGLVLRIVDYDNRDDNVMKTWSPGDILTFKAQVKDDVLFLKAKRVNVDNDKVEPIMILDINEEPLTGLRIVEIKDGGKIVKLSDGSIWQFSWYHQLSTKKWHENEHVIVLGDGAYNVYDFINVDAPVQDEAHSARAEYVISAVEIVK